MSLPAVVGVSVSEVSVMSTSAAVSKASETTPAESVAAGTSDGGGEGGSAWPDDEHPTTSQAHVVKSLADAIATLSAQGAEPFLAPHRLDDAGWVANRWCEILPLPLEVKQRLMTLEDPVARLEVVDSLMRARHAAQ